MNLEDQIGEYLRIKNYSPNTFKSHRSILLDFNRWQMHYPAVKMAEKADRYDQFLRENCFRKPKTADKQIGVVRRFCRWLADTGRVAAFRLDEQLLGRPEMRSVPAAPVGPDEVARMLHVAAAGGEDVALRDACMMLLAVTCGLTAAEISSLGAGSVFGTASGGELWYCGDLVEMPAITSAMLKWYVRGRRSCRGTDPLFTTTNGDDGDRLDPAYVRERVSALLATVGCEYEDAVPGDCQLRIAQHFRGLGEEERRVAAATVQTLSFKGSKMPVGLLAAMRGRFVERERGVPTVSVEGLSVTVSRR